MGKMVEFPCAGGRTAGGYLAKAAGEGPAIVVIQEWWGLNDHIKAIADRFAAAGYSALAPDLYDGRVTQDPDEAGHWMGGLDWVGATETDVAGALEYLKQSHAKAGVMGFCMGGALTVIAGVKLPDCDAGVCYYGIPPKDQADPSAMKVPFQGHFGTLDEWCNPAAVAALEADLAGSGAGHEIHIYENCDHAFFNDQRPDVYDQAAAELSWQRTLDFLGRHL